MRSTWSSGWSVGMKAPEWQSLTHNSEVIGSSDLVDKKYILFFYNHDGSETCTKEACNVRDNITELTKRGYVVFGVSEDTPKKHQKFIEKFQLPYTLLSDKDNVLAKVFDIYGQKEFMGRISDAVHRTTFVINENGMIEAVIHPVDSAHHADQIIEALNAKTGSL